MVNIDHSGKDSKRSRKSGTALKCSTIERISFTVRVQGGETF
jgi:hypothetical protein